MLKGASKPLMIVLAGSAALVLLFGSAAVCVLVGGYLFPGSNANYAQNGRNAWATPNPTQLPTARPTSTANLGNSDRPTPEPTREPTAEPTSTRPTVDSIRESLTKGNIAFNKPSVMVLEETKDVQLVLSPSVAAQELKELVKGDGQIESREVEVSDYMEATLYGDNFVISNATQRKLVSTKGVTEWHWDVTPTKAGKQRLHLKLSAIVIYKDGEKPLEIKTFHELIEVNVTVSQRFYAFAGAIGSHLQWIAPSLLIPMGLWVWNRWRKKKKAAESKASDDLHDTVDPDAAGSDPPKRIKKAPNRRKAPK